MIHIAVVEDEQRDREIIIDYIEKYAAANGESIKISQFENARLFLSNYNPIYDLVFLDSPNPPNAANLAIFEIDPRKTCCGSKETVFLDAFASFAGKNRPLLAMYTMLTKSACGSKRKPPGIAGQWGAGGGIDPRPYSCTSFARTRSFLFVQNTGAISS